MKGKLIWTILALAFLFRAASVTGFPMGFNADEASFGYDAYSILKTGKDQWGKSTPLVLKSFGDYKSPLYSYLDIPFVAAFGLNVFSVRIVSVIIGTLAVFVTYLLSKKITKSENIALFAATLLALNPWSIMLSRGAVEANLITFMLPLGIYFFLQNRYSLASFFFGLNLFTYHAAKVITPLIIIMLLIIFRENIFKTSIKRLFLPMAILFIFFLGLLYSFKIGGGSRISERIITQGALEQGFNERMEALTSGNNSIIAKLLHNKYQVIAKRFTDNYRQYFSYGFLIQKGAGEGSYAMIPGIGVIHLFEGLFMLGVVPLFLFKKNYRNVILALTLWLLIAPLPAALASGIGYSGNRASAMLPVMQIIGAIGFYGWYSFIKKWDKKIVYSITTVIIVIGVFNIAGFVYEYFRIPDNAVLRQMGYGNLDVAGWISTNPKLNKLTLSRSLSEPQIFLAFANKINPNDYQKSTAAWDLEAANVAWVDQLPSYSLENFTIKSIDWNKDFTASNTLVIRADELPDNVVAYKTFYYPDGTPNIYIVDANQKIYAQVK